MSQAIIDNVRPGGEGLKRLSRVLSAVLDETVEIDRLDQVLYGGNYRFHKKAILTDGRIIGLKTTNRVKNLFLSKRLCSHRFRRSDLSRLSDSNVP